MPDLTVRKIFSLLFLFFISDNQLNAQILPKEGSSLNYRLVGFQFPTMPGEVYKLEIAEGNYCSPDLFKQNITLSLNCKTNKIIAEVPAFGKQYTWRVVTRNNKSVAAVELHHFNTATIENVDTGLTRLRILKHAETHNSAYVFIDDTRTLYDMNGQPVWFLPNIEHFPNDHFEVRNLNLTPQGTITFILGDMAYEVNYNADIIWKAPTNGKASGGNYGGYHHQVTRLPNGHYMLLGNEDILCKKPSANGGSFTIIGDDKIVGDKNGGYIKVPFGTIIEYDEQGNVVWLWKSSAYFKGSDIVYHKKTNGTPEVISHENAFYFDEKNKVVNISFRNISRILKVKYPEGNVISSYGEIFEPGVPEKGNGLFCHQHSCRISEQGYLYLFNNNLCNHGAPPEIIMMQEPVSEKGKLKKIWEYACTIDGIEDSEKKAPYQFKSGGNVIELPDHSFFAAMSAPYYSKVFIVDRDKRILWSAVPEKKNPGNEKWEISSLYEASIINTPEELEHLVWH